jgi:hypothetical protein
MQELAVSEGVVSRWSPMVLGISYFVLSILWRLPDPWWWINLASFVPMLPVQLTAQRLNHRKLNVVTEDPNNKYSGKNIALICVGALLILTALAGTFMPE